MKAVDRLIERYTKPAKDKIMRERGIDIDNLMTEKLRNWEAENYISIFKTLQNGQRVEDHRIPIDRPKFIVEPGDTELNTYIKEIYYYKRIGYQCLAENSYGGYYIYSPVFDPSTNQWEFQQVYAYSVKYFVENTGDEIFPNVTGSKKVKNDPKNKYYEVNNMVVIYNHDLGLKDIKLPLEYCSALGGGGYQRYLSECGPSLSLSFTKVYF
jgi:hypothetical protein